ncbi:dentin sialophosphoprotein isoform X2 [Orussus abietinus]|nr:dentin sialophosphoprotein isoform X2 [Orussus abietinus]
MRKHPALVQYWVDTGLAPCTAIIKSEDLSSSGSSLSECEVLTLPRSLVLEKDTEKAKGAGGSSCSSVDTAAYILSNANTTKKADAIAIVEGAKNSVNVRTKDNIKQELIQERLPRHLTNDDITTKNNNVIDFDSNSALKKSESDNVKSCEIALPVSVCNTEVKNNVTETVVNVEDSHNITLTLNQESHEIEDSDESLIMSVSKNRRSMQAINSLQTNGQSSNNTHTSNASKHGKEGSDTQATCNDLNAYEVVPKVTLRRKLFTGRESPTDLLIANGGSGRKSKTIKRGIHPALDSPYATPKKKKRPSKYKLQRRSKIKLKQNSFVMTTTNGSDLQDCSKKSCNDIKVRNNEQVSMNDFFNSLDLRPVEEINTEVPITKNSRRAPILDMQAMEFMMDGENSFAKGNQTIASTKKKTPKRRKGSKLDSRKSHRRTSQRKIAAMLKCYSNLGVDLNPVVLIERLPEHHSDVSDKCNDKTDTIEMITNEAEVKLSVPEQNSACPSEFLSNNISDLNPVSHLNSSKNMVFSCEIQNIDLDTVDSDQSTILICECKNDDTSKHSLRCDAMSTCTDSSDSIILFTGSMKKRETTKRGKKKTLEYALLQKLEPVLLLKRLPKSVCDRYLEKSKGNSEVSGSISVELLNSKDGLDDSLSPKTLADEGNFTRSNPSRSQSKSESLEDNSTSPRHLSSDVSRLNRSGKIGKSKSLRNTFESSNSRSFKHLSTVENLLPKDVMPITLGTRSEFNVTPEHTRTVAASNDILTFSDEEDSFTEFVKSCWPKKFSESSLNISAKDQTRSKIQEGMDRTSISSNKRILQSSSAQSKSSTSSKNKYEMNVVREVNNDCHSSNLENDRLSPILLTRKSLGQKMSSYKSASTISSPRSDKSSNSVIFPSTVSPNNRSMSQISGRSKSLKSNQSESLFAKIPSDDEHMKEESSYSSLKDPLKLSDSEPDADTGIDIQQNTFDLKSSLTESIAMNAKSKKVYSKGSLSDTIYLSSDESRGGLTHKIKNEIPSESKQDNSTPLQNKIPERTTDTWNKIDKRNNSNGKRRKIRSTRSQKKQRRNKEELHLLESSSDEDSILEIPNIASTHTVNTESSNTSATDVLKALDDSLDEAVIVLKLNPRTTPFSNKSETDMDDMSERKSALNDKKSSDVESTTFKTKYLELWLTE